MVGSGSARGFGPGPEGEQGDPAPAAAVVGADQFDVMAAHAQPLFRHRRTVEEVQSYEQRTEVEYGEEQDRPRSGDAWSWGHASEPCGGRQAAHEQGCVMNDGIPDTEKDADCDEQPGGTANLP